MQRSSEIVRLITPTSFARRTQPAGCHPWVGTPAPDPVGSRTAANCEPHGPRRRRRSLADVQLAGGVRVEHRDEFVDVAVRACRDEPSGDGTMPGGSIGARPLSRASRTLRRARLASCRHAAGGLPTVSAIRSKGNWKTSCRTNATRSAGDSCSSTTSSASRTSSSRVTRSAGSGASEAISRSRARPCPLRVPGATART